MPANLRLYLARTADRYYGNPLELGGVPNAPPETPGAFINVTRPTAVVANASRPTRVARVAFGTADGVGCCPGTYGAGDRFVIEVTFTDEVVFSDPPSLFLNTGFGPRGRRPRTRARRSRASTDVARSRTRR